MELPKSCRLIVVDVQKDFLPGGSLAVPKGDEVVDPINRLVKHFDGKVIFTKDSHPHDHGSFASNHGAEVFSMGKLGDRPQVMWPDHCVYGTRGSDLAAELILPERMSIVRKGEDPAYDSYSGFKDDGGKFTSLKGLLQAAEVNEILVCGLATDYCVKATVLDGIALGLKVGVVGDACRGVDMTSGDVETAYHEMVAAGAVIMGVNLLVNPEGETILADGGRYEEERKR